MNLSAELLRGVAEVLRAKAGYYDEESNPWAMFQDAADALADTADWLAEEERG